MGFFDQLRRLFHSARGRSIEFDLRPYRRLLVRIKEREFDGASDDDLARMSEALRERALDGAGGDDLLVEAFALVCEASRQTIGLFPFDVQILAGIAMHQGKLAEMQTGEGKTLAAVMPAYLNALAGRGVHVLTFNDYLARRDAGWMGPIFRSLGVSVGFVQEGMSIGERQEAYGADVTYVTAKEAGFDFLRDRLCVKKTDLVHRPFHYAIVDEADSILIDEARVPLVIARATSDPPADPRRVAEFVEALDAKADYDTDEHSRNVFFNERGLDRAEAAFGSGDLHAPENLALLTELNLALHARALLRRDVDYIVRQGKLELVDEFTGRVAVGRRWPDGLQAAVEAKEGLAVQSAGMICGSITLQHLLPLYPKISGMTATASSAGDEFSQFYGLTIVVIPPNRKSIRVDEPDVVFTHKVAKQKALVEEIARSNRIGRPVLVGTGSVEESEQLAADLSDAGIASNVLNAKNDEEEAGIIAQAASLGAVTISTNMAGRGTDVRLGGEEEADRREVVDLMGLFVIGTNRHETRRIDNQLRGRAGRQGDPGSSRFYISLEDDLIQRYGVGGVISHERHRQEQDEPIEDPALRAEITRAQRMIESENFEIRRTLWRYSSLIERQRQQVHARRQAVLLDESFPRLLEAREPERYCELRRTLSAGDLDNLERRITLYMIDRLWAEHLTRISEIRETIHLAVLGLRDPLDEFHKTAGLAFRDLLERIDHEIVEWFRCAEITEGGVSLPEDGIDGPASTWTYLVNDNPFGTWLERAARGIKRKLSGG